MTISTNKAQKLITRNIVVIRQELGLTQNEMAAYTDLSRRTIQRIEAASQNKVGYNPLLSTAVKIAGAFNVSVQELIAEKLEVQ
ncbi:helix-turn-helix protein [compost metagenome]